MWAGSTCARRPRSVSSVLVLLMSCKSPPPPTRRGSSSSSATPFIPCTTMPPFLIPLDCTDILLALPFVQSYAHGEHQ